MSANRTTASRFITECPGSVYHRLWLRQSTETVTRKFNDCNSILDIMQVIRSYMRDALTTSVGGKVMCGDRAAVCCEAVTRRLSAFWEVTPSLPPYPRNGYLLFEWPVKAKAHMRSPSNLAARMASTLFGKAHVWW